MKKTEFLKQKMMMKVIYALIPIVISSIYFFGWRILLILTSSLITCFVVEWLMSARGRGKISQAVFVTALLYGLSLPPTIPIWMVVIGAVVAILFGKEVFGGFGKNVFNPAVVGRMFIYVSFPNAMTSQFVPTFKGIYGGFRHWSFQSLVELPDYIKVARLTKIDTLTAATPMWSRGNFGFSTNMWELITGNIGGIFQFNGNPMVLGAGSIGEISVIIIVLMGIYLVISKTAKWELIVSTLLGAFAMNLIFLITGDPGEVPPLFFTMFSGGLFFGAVFMVTDPISAPKDKIAQWLYGIVIGSLIVLFRYKAIFAGGVGFSILIGNILAPSLDLWIKRIKQAKKGAKI